MSKKLNIQAINKNANKFNEKISQQIEDRFGNTYTLEVSKFFKKTDIQKLIVDYVAFKEQLNEISTQVKTIEQSFFLFPILLVKYFTNVPIPDDVEEMLVVAETLINLDLLDKIIGVLPQEEIKRVNELIKKMSDNLPLITDMLKEDDE